MKQVPVAFSIYLQHSCRVAARRSGESAGARLAGAFSWDRDIQQNDINDLALDMSDFTLRTSKHLPTR
ncbi:MAG TPA: hypothetical protein VJ063_02050 [Verrucomicrobiae bacterium]|nr:hypothetical protein [Verrucomicrobiae bacterium]